MSQLKEAMVVPLRDYIEIKHVNKATFAEVNEVWVQQVDKWLRNDYIVVDGAMYRKVREIK